MKLKKCRVCYNNKFVKLFSLGNLSYTGKFASTKKKIIPKKNVSLVMCHNCKLVQLDQDFNPEYLYGKDYGYRTGINHTMTKHVQHVAKEALKIAKIKKGEYVLDIASNDGTLLNFYGRNVITVGIDPILKKFSKFYKKINYTIPNFFSFSSLKNSLKTKKFKAITALSVFYDIKKPNNFIKDIKKILDKNGVFFLEHADLLSIIKYNLFDTICHEHLEYYSTKIIMKIMSQNELKIFDIKKNNINGGSLRYLISHKNSKYKVNHRVIRSILKEEKIYELEKKKTYINFFNQINLQKKKLNLVLKKAKSFNKAIHGYGASTKGNVLLQYFELDNKIIDFISDRNPKKYNLYTPGTKIKIISEKDSRDMNPDYYLVLPWHFKKEILKRENKIKRKGTKFIFPLPKLEII